MIGYGLRLSGAGVAIGLLCALVITPLMTSMLVGVKPEDPATFVAIALVFSIIVAAASWLPAHRAARLDPTVALRDE